MNRREWTAGALSRPGTNTRDRLLREAGRAFAARGYAGVTVRELAVNAGANVAAINYHFGSKEGLYAAVVEHALALMRPTGDMEQPVLPDVALAAAVRRIVSALLIQDEAGTSTILLRLIARELLDRPDEDGLHPARSCVVQVEKVLSDGLSDSVPVAHVGLVAGWLVSQCLLLSTLARNAPRGRDAQALVDEVTLLALHGLTGFGGRNI
jgi:TetR/AcrR family transcriptional regulator, regulator of cefoperazone and chloramphenicol sensitivity